MRSLARTERRAGSSPIHSVLAPRSWKNVPGRTWSRVLTCDSGRPSTKTCSAWPLMGASAVRVSEGATSVVGGVQPTSRQSPPLGEKPRSSELPSSQTASPGQFCSVSRLRDGKRTSSW